MCITLKLARNKNEQKKTWCTKTEIIAFFIHNFSLHVAILLYAENVFLHRFLNSVFTLCVPLCRNTFFLFLSLFFHIYMHNIYNTQVRRSQVTWLGVTCWYLFCSRFGAVAELDGCLPFISQCFFLSIRTIIAAAAVAL